MATQTKWYMVAGLLSTLAVPAWGQAGRPAVTGRVLDGQHRPVPGATLRLLHLPDSSTAAGTQADAAGRYELAAAPGRYLLRATAVGLQEAALPVTLRAGLPLALPDLRLPAAPAQLGEVTVQGQPPLVEAEPGKLVYHLDRRVSASGTSAFDVVQRLPGVRVTQDDNLELKGNGNVNVLLDGKRTYLTGNQLAALLRSLPAENLARVEVLSVPGAQHDAAGSAGVLNLVTKRSAQPGYALDLGAGAGTGRYPQTTETAIGNVQLGRFNLFGSYGYHYKKSYLDRTSYRVLDGGSGPTAYDRASYDPATESGHNYRLGVAAKLGTRHALEASYTGTSSLWTRTGAGPTSVRNLATGQGYGVLNDNLTREPGRNHLLNLGYQARLDTTGRQLTVEGDYAHYDFNPLGALGSQLTDAAGQATQPAQQLVFSQPSLTTIRSLKADLVWPVAGWQLAGGGKVAAVRADNDFRYDSLQGGQLRYSPTLSNHFVYDEQVTAAYATVRRAWGQTTLDAGLRLEHTRSVGNLLSRDLVNSRAYTNLFPTLSLSRPVGPRYQLSAVLSRRINRPQYADLNPARFFFDKFSYHEGNPFLQPETAWKAAVAATYRQDYVLTVSASRTNNAMLGTGRQNPATGELVLSTGNFTYRDDYDAQLVLPLKPTTWWTVQNTFDLQYARLLAYLAGPTEEFAPSRLTLDAASTHTLRLPGGVTLELAAAYTSPMLAGITLYRSWFTLDAGLQKKLLAGKLALRLAGTDLLHTARYWGYSLYAGANTSYNHRGDTRRVNLSVSYHLGGELRGSRARTLEEAGRVR